MNYPAYPTYKESGVPWLGKVPEHWTSVSLKWISNRYAGGTPDKSNDLYWENGNIPWLNSGAVNDGYITNPSSFITEEGFKHSSAKWIPEDALVIALAGQGKTKGMVAQMGIKATCNQSMAAIVTSSKIYTRYLYWWLEGNYHKIRNMAGGEQRDGLNLVMLGSIPCPLSSFAEQTAIANFLDRETGRIDTLIKKKRRLIALLKEKRSAMISRTVTRGLPAETARGFGLEPHTRFKDSGIEWLGKVPEGWEVFPLRRVIKFVKTGNTPRGAEDYHFEENGFNWYSPSDFSDDIYLASSSRALSLEGKAEVRIFPDSAVMLVGIGATIGKVSLAVAESSCNQQINGIVCGENLKPVYATYYLKTMRDFIVKCGKFTTMPIINQDETKSLIIPVPPISEQTAIATYLDRETAKIDKLTGKVEQAIERLQEYRTALITAAVTGKIDVRYAVDSAGPLGLAAEEAETYG